ncbi:MAG: alpha-isopropylmalate synthase regulatory domain-containing protein, partial [Oscillospiraceae bacterium]
EYEPIIRINSQSGKGGAAYIMQEFGFTMPKAMHPEFGAVVQEACEEKGKELRAQEVFELFIEEYRNVCGPYKLLSHKFEEEKGENEDLTRVHFVGILKYNGNAPQEIEGVGSGPIEAFFNAFSHVGVSGFKFKNYSEHAISVGADAKACSYIELEAPNGKSVFGVGISHNINYASLKGILCAINRCQKNVVREPQPAIF